MEILENVPISTLTTMRLGGPARYVCVVKSAEEVAEAVQFASDRELPLWPMGGGANTIGRDEGFSGVILLNRLRGIETISEAADRLVLRASAGEVWDDLVQFACEKGYSGIEAMSKIPGTVGAAPVQNIGAYGQDIAGVILEASVFDLSDNSVKVLRKSEMDLRYRHTRFNFGPDAGRFIILSVTIQLSHSYLQPPFYNSLQHYIDEHSETDFSPLNIRRIVSEIRASKLPDPEIIPSAGSFFKNVNISAAEIPAAEAQGIPVWRNPDGSGKINSGWLIEACGLKGQTLHGFEINDKAALVLMNKSANGYSDLNKARETIIQKVNNQFGYMLEQEPVELVPPAPSAEEKR